jgi:hypothetical protein
MTHFETTCLLFLCNDSFYVHSTEETATRFVFSISVVRPTSLLVSVKVSVLPFTVSILFLSRCTFCMGVKLGL